MVQSDQFHNHAGFDLHARTTIDTYYSYIESMALRVGVFTLEIQKDQLYLNGLNLSYEDLPLNFGDDFQYRVVLVNQDTHVKEIAVDLHQDSTIAFKFYKHYLTFNLSGHPSDFGDAIGLLGEFGTGEMYGRSGVPMKDFTSYGFEWQVLPKQDPVLFHSERAPQLPYERCRMPTAARPARRQLRANRSLMQQAQEACAANHAGSDIDLCLKDVLITGDLGLATAW